MKHYIQPGTQVVRFHLTTLCSSGTPRVTGVTFTGGVLDYSKRGGYDASQAL